LQAVVVAVVVVLITVLHITVEAVEQLVVTEQIHLQD
jgi:hypothetical protein